MPVGASPPRVIGWDWKKSLPATFHRWFAGAGYRLGLEKVSARDLPPAVRRRGLSVGTGKSLCPRPSTGGSPGGKQPLEERKPHLQHRFVKTKARMMQRVRAVASQQKK